MIYAESLEIGMFFIFLFIIAFDAIADAMAYKDVHQNKDKFTTKYSVLKHSFQSLMVLMLFSLLLLKVHSYMHFIVYLCGFILLRFAVFDSIYNKLIGQHYLYLGNTSLYDKLFSKFMSHKSATVIFYVLKTNALVISLAIIQRINEWF